MFLCSAADLDPGQALEPGLGLLRAILCIDGIKRENLFLGIK